MTDQLGLEFDAVPKRRRAAALRSHHVRSHQTAGEALKGERQAQHQEDAILQHFRFQDAAVPGVRFTPSQIWRAFEERWPLTSIRRAMTNLASESCYPRPPLVHFPGDRRPGLYGRPESCWGLAP